MSVMLRLKLRDQGDHHGPPPQRHIRLDASFYDDLQALIGLIDEAIYSETAVTLLTATQDAFELEPRRYAAIAVLQQAD